MGLIKIQQLVQKMEKKTFGPYSNFKYWRSKWGWDFEQPEKNTSIIKNKYF